MKTQSGFTLIEMVAVIIILAIMAATALPKFANLSADARYASVNAMAGAMRSAAVMAKSKWLAAQSANLTTVEFDAATKVSVMSASVANIAAGDIGYPYGAGAKGIWATLDNAGESYKSHVIGSKFYIWPVGVAASSTCNATYESGTVTLVPDNGSTAGTACS